MKIPHILVNSANVLHILPILVNSAMLVNSASINMQYYEYFAYTNGDVTGVQGPRILVRIVRTTMLCHAKLKVSDARDAMRAASGQLSNQPNHATRESGPGYKLRS